MRISDSVANYILELLNEDGGHVEIQRNELASSLGCVPSQINYVITSRFTPEQGYIVESRRGGGGYIRITRITMNKSSAVMHTVNAVGNQLDSCTARAMLSNLAEQDIIPIQIARAMAAAMTDQAYSCIPQELRDTLRASVFKNMLMTLLNN